MKNYKNFCIYDFSDYAEEITGDELFKINGGAEIENTIKAQANAKPGDTVTRDDGTTHTIWQGDIDWAKEIMASREEPCSTQQTNTPETPSISTQTIEKKEEELSVQIQNNWTYNPDELDSDKRFNAKDINGQYLMTIACDDKINFEDFASYYITVGKYGSVGTKVYDGIGLTDKNGNIISILDDNKNVLDYAELINPTYTEKKRNLSKKWNSKRVENNQLKIEKALFNNSENSRNGLLKEIGVYSFSSKALNKGLTGDLYLNLLSGNVSAKDAPDEYWGYSFSINILSAGAGVGVNISDKRFVVSAEVGASLGFGFETVPGQFNISLPIEDPVKIFV